MKQGITLPTQHVSWYLPRPAEGLHISCNNEGHIYIYAARYKATQYIYKLAPIGAAWGSHPVYISAITDKKGVDVEKRGLRETEDCPLDKGDSTKKKVGSQECRTTTEKAVFVVCDLLQL